VKNAQQGAANWLASAGRAATEWQSGVEGYTGDWAGATTSQQAAMLTNLTQSVTSGKWARGVQAVGTNGWKSKTVSKAANFGVGFNAGAAAQAASMAKIMNALSSIVPSLPPRGTFEQNKIRSTSLMDQLHALNGQLGAK
jgi:hypothetical protein